MTLNSFEDAELLMNEASLIAALVCTEEEEAGSCELFFLAAVHMSSVSAS